MKPWPQNPRIYEINTWVWLKALSKKTNKPVDLSNVPEEEWDLIASLGFDAVWFMGVWERSPAGIKISMKNKGLLEDFKRAVPDFTAEDNVGSPYCVRNYVVDAHLGGPKGLSAARKALAKRSIRLLLDFVPNHVAPDHPWVTDHPEYFIPGNSDGEMFACGKDPFFPAWPDVLQLNAFNVKLRQAVTKTISEIADQCDGIRCDMAMLVLNDTFERTWGARAGTKPSEDYWRTIIPAIKKNHPDFKFIAEAYWDLEWELQQQGFDFCYDKKLYDRMEHGDAENVRQHLLADLPYQQKMVRFIENHDEPRAATAFPEAKGRAAALAILTLPGMKLLHEGQFEGLKIRLPVFLARRTLEPVNNNSAAFYKHLLQETNRDIFRNGNWSLSAKDGWPDNQTCQNILAWVWKNDKERFLIIVNFSDKPSQALVKVPLHGKKWRLDDALSNESYERTGSDLDTGLYVNLEPWKFHYFQLKESL